MKTNVKDAVSLADEYRRKSEADMNMRVLDWIMYAEFERGNQNIYKSKTTRQVIKLTEGAYIPEKNGYFAEDYMPIFNHLGVSSDAITARGNANPLKPNVRPKTSEDEDRDAAKASTLALQSYDQTLDTESTRMEIVNWFKITGNAFVKTWWDMELGDILPPLPEDTLGIGSMHLLDSSRNPQRTGDLQRKVIPPHAMIISPGASSMENLLYIGDQSALDVNKAKIKYGIDVEPEENLQDLQQLRAVDTTMNTSNGILENCVRVIDLYLPPSLEHPTPEQQQFGRHIIVVGGKLVEDGVWDRELMVRYGIWHPYVQFKFISIAGDFWGETPYKDLCEMQTEINRQWRMAAGSKQIIRNILVYPDTGTVDVEKLRLTKHGRGLAVLPYLGNTSPNILSVHTDEASYITRIEHLKQNMDDRLATYKVTRGAADPSVTSGKQQEALIQASTVQASPLAMQLAKGFCQVWQLELRLLAVHLTMEKALRLVGEDNEIISITLRPEHLTSDDVEVEDLQAFLTDPETRKQQIRQNYMAGFYGNPTDPAVRQKVARMLEIPFGEELDEMAKDVDQAKRENRAFSQGDFDEKNPAVIKQIQEEALASYQQAVMLAETQGLPLPPPPAINLWKQPRPWENHSIHIETHNSMRKSPEFEKLCEKYPILYDVVEFHVNKHEQFMAEAAQKQMLAMMPMAQMAQAQAGPPSKEKSQNQKESANTPPPI